MNENIVCLDLKRRTGFSLEVDLSLPSSGVTVLFGPSGCGKTTVLRCVAGLERARGRVVVGDECWQDDEAGIFLPTYRRNLGYVFQEASLFPHLNVEKNLRFGLERTAIPDGENRLSEAVELLGIGQLMGRNVHELSGGERQRCAIARALALCPSVLLMDEPLAALDWSRKQEILPWLERLRDELRLPILYVTHASDEAARLADRIVLMRNGRAVAVGGVNDVLPLLSGTVTDDAMGAEVILKGIVASCTTEWGTMMIDVGSGWHLETAGDLPRSRSVRLRVQARDVSIALEHPKMSTSIRNVLPARIMSIRELGPYAEILLQGEDFDQRLVARILRRSASDLSLRPGLRVWAQVKAVAVIH